MYIGIDIGGTKTLVTSSDSLDKPEVIKSLKFENTNNFNQDFENLVNAIKELSANSHIDAIGVGLPGTLDQAKTMIVDASNLWGWNNQEVKQKLAEIFNTRVYLENDVVLAALAEAEYGNSNSEDFIFVIWGTGVGGSRVQKEADKFKSILIEVGFSFVSDRKGFEYWEQNCGGKGIESKYGKPAEQLSEDEWNEVETFMAKGLVSVANITSVPIIVLGGGVTHKQKERVKNIYQRVKLIQDELVLPVPEIKVSNLENAGALGGYALIKQNSSQ